MRGRTVLVTGGSGFIGRNLVEHLIRGGARPVNVDLRPPPDPDVRALWRHGDVLDPESLRRTFARARPEIVVHLAARTDCDERTTVEDGYATNTVGTTNVVRAAAEVGTVRRLAFASSQFVVGPGHRVDHIDGHAPHTVYGESKARAEALLRAADPPLVWTIVRPVNVWGPYHERYRREVWRVIERGLYLHPGRRPVVRTYGYVGNVVWQLTRLLALPPEQVHRRVFYLGDEPADIRLWVDAFSRHLRGRVVRVVPRLVVRGVAALGDVARALGFEPPLHSSRYRSMTSDYLTPTAETHALLGPPPFSLEEGVRRTVSWLRDESLGPTRPARGEGRTPTGRAPRAARRASRSRSSTPARH